MPAGCAGKRQLDPGEGESSPQSRGLPARFALVTAILVEEDTLEFPKVESFTGGGTDTPKEAAALLSAAREEGERFFPQSYRDHFWTKSKKKVPKSKTLELFLQSFWWR